MARVVLAFNLNRGAGPEELEFDTPSTVSELTDTLSRKHRVTAIECTREISDWVRQLEAEKPDLIFNVAEGYAGDSRESFYPCLYEQLGFAYTGSGPAAMCIGQDKALTKWFATQAGVLTPRWKLVRGPADFTDSLYDFSYPAIVKLNSEGSSLGLDQGSVTFSAEEAGKRIAALWDSFHKPILLEAFVDGTDLSVSYVEGLGMEVFPPVTYNKRIVGTVYDWSQKATSFRHTDVVLDAEHLPLAGRDVAMNALRKLVPMLGVQGYARADFRLAPDGQCWFLEINCQVEMASGAEFAAPIIRSAVSFEELLHHIASVGLAKMRTLSASKHCPAIALSGP